MIQTILLVIYHLEYLQVEKAVIYFQSTFSIIMELCEDGLASWQVITFALFCMSRVLQLPRFQNCFLSLGWIKNEPHWFRRCSSLQGD